MPFTDSASSAGDSFNASERRTCARQAPQSLSYVHLDETNGGILINLSEGGLAVHAAMSVMDDELPHVRLQTPHSKGWLESRAEVIWTSDSRRMVGVRFVEPAEDFRKQVADWLAAETIVDSHSVTSTFPVETEREHRAPTREEIAARPHRPTGVARTAAGARAKDFEIAARDASGEPTALRRNTQAIPEISHPAPARVTRNADIAPAQAVMAKEEQQRSRGGFIPLMALLAVLSLAAGWEGGRGDVLSTIAALFKPSAAASPTGTLLHSAAANLAAPSFEVVDTNNQAWLVPFAGPTTAPQGAPLPAMTPQAAAAANRPAPPAPAATKPFQPRILTAPQSGAHRSIQANAAAPELPAAQNASGGILSSMLSDGSVRVLPPPSATGASAGLSNLVPAQLLRSVNPTYPKPAFDSHISGTVKVHARINENGSVTDVKATSGSPLLAPAAVDAVRKWQYKPETLDGHPVASEIDVTILFTLPQ